MKRIIIPAGSVSGKKDYILEIPVEPNDIEEDSIYVLDGKSSKGSVKSLSDYFYEEKDETNVNQQHQAQLKQNEYHSNPSADQKPTWPFEPAQNYSLPNSFENYPLEKGQLNPKSIQKHENSIDEAKYIYYKSLGFDESEIQTLLSKKGKTSVDSRFQKKHIKFNRLGVKDFLKSGDQVTPGYNIDRLADPNISPNIRPNVSTYDIKDTGISSSVSKAFAEDIPPVKYSKSKEKTYFTKTRPVSHGPEYIEPNNLFQQTSASSHHFGNAPTPTSRYSPKYPSLTRTPSPTSQKRPIYSTRPNLNASAISTNQNNRNQISTSQSIIDFDDEIFYSDEKEVAKYTINKDGITRETLRTLPGTSVVSKAPNIKMNRIDYQ